MTQRLSLRLLITALLGVGLLLPVAGIQAALAEPLAPSDQFGYLMVTNVLDEAVFMSKWEELYGSSAAARNFDSDDGIEVDIGFTFRFYENAYTRVFINDNGLLTFGSKTTRPTNEPIPRDTMPNNYIAAFWDNLDVSNIGDRKVYYETRGATGNRYLLVEWYQVTRVGASAGETLTFQIKLTERGDIFFYYKEMNASGLVASAGIEDPDGVDGIQVAYRQPGYLVNFREVVISRPADNYRLKALPTYSGRFVINGVATFRLTVRNISEAQNDTVNIIAPPLPGWEINYRDAQTLSPLALPFNLAAGASRSINVLVKPAGAAAPGNYVDFNLTFQSTKSSASATTRLQAAVPAAFAMGYYLSPDYKVLQDGRALSELIWLKSDYGLIMQDPFAGRNIVFARAANKNYVYVWDHPNMPSETTGYREVRFVILNRFGGILRGMTDVDDHASPPEWISDTKPAVAIAPTGQIAIAFRRAPSVGGGTYIENIFLNVRSADGSDLPSPKFVQVTNSVEGERVGNVRVVSTTNRFILVWEYSPAPPQPDDSVFKELWTAVFDHNGNRISANQRVVSQAGFNYMYPALTDLADGTALLSYTEEQTADQSYIKYRVCNPNCQGVTEHTLHNARGRNSHAALFSSRKLLLAWTDPISEAIAYVLIPNYNSPDPNQIPTLLASPSSRSQDYLNLMITPDDRAVLVWMDAVNSNYLFYALLDANGNVLTPPMVFMGEAGGLAMNTSEIGQGLALYDGSYRQYLSFMRR